MKHGVNGVQFQDGKISSVCANHEEDTWVVNFKRGIISAFQNSMESLEENYQGTEVQLVPIVVF